MVLSPSYSLLFHPAQAVAIALLLECVAAAQLLPDAVRQTRWPEVAPLTLTACAMVPVGSYFLVTAEAEVTRRVIGATVLAFVVLMFGGWRYGGRPRPLASIGVGAVSGILAGSTSVGAPPAILYLLAYRNPVQVSRANILTHVGATAVAAFVLLVIYGAVDTTVITRAALMIPFFIAGNVVGRTAFGRVDERMFRRAVLLMLLCAGGIALLA